MVVAAADMEASAPVSVPPVSDGPKSSPPLQRSAQKTNSSSQQQSSLPPRLQKKQRQAEEENYLKYYKPMDYMRQTNSYHRKVAADTDTHRTVDNGRHNGSARHVRDVNSRGSVGNRTLWTDNLTNGRSSGTENVPCDNSMQSNTKIIYGQPNSGDARLSDGTACEQKAPVAVLTSNSNKLTSVEAGVASLNIQSTVSNHMMSQPSYVGPVSVFL